MVENGMVIRRPVLTKKGSWGWQIQKEEWKIIIRDIEGNETLGVGFEGLQSTRCGAWERYLGHQHCRNVTRGVGTYWRSP